MGITYESICNKLGFDPVKGNPQKQEVKQDSWLIDDSKVNPFSVLTDEESDYLFEFFKSNKHKSI